MTTQQIQDSWQRWLKASAGLVATLHHQTAAITLRDAKRVQDLRPLASVQLVRLKEIEEQAEAGVRELASRLGIEPTMFALAERVGGGDGQAIQGLANEVVLRTRKIRELVEKNKALMRSESTVVDGALIFLPKAPTVPSRPLRRTLKRACSVASRN